MKRPHIEHDDGFLFLGRKLSALKVNGDGSPAQPRNLSAPRLLALIDEPPVLNLCHVRSAKASTFASSPSVRLRAQPIGAGTRTTMLNAATVVFRFDNPRLLFPR